MFRELSFKVEKPRAGVQIVIGSNLGSVVVVVL